MSVKIKLNKVLLEQALFEVDASTGVDNGQGANATGTIQTPAQTGNSSVQQSVGNNSVVNGDASKPAVAATPAQVVKPGQEPVQQGQSQTSQQVVNASTNAQQNQQEKVPDTKPQVNTGELAQANQPTLISGCLIGLIGLLNRQDAGGIYLKAIVDSSSASEDLKKAAQTFAAVNPEDANAVIQGFVAFANTCSAELQKLKEAQPTEAANNQETPAQ